jgi:FkbM family methyltransferase
MRSFGHALRDFAKLAGIQRSGQPSKHSQRAILLDSLCVDIVLDVGANVGQYAGIHLRDWTGYRGRIASFEPVSACYARCAAMAIEDPSWVTFPYGLSDVEGTFPISVPAGNEDLSSLHDFTDVGKKAMMIETTTTSIEQVTLRRLDDVIGDISSPTDRLALKLDVQGHETAVLRGSERTLRDVVLVECEMPLIRMFAGLWELFAAAGFFPVGMQSNYVDSSSGYAMDADVFLARY